MYIFFSLAFLFVSDIHRGIFMAVAVWFLSCLEFCIHEIGLNYAKYNFNYYTLKKIKYLKLYESHVKPSFTV